MDILKKFQFLDIIIYFELQFWLESKCQINYQANKEIIIKFLPKKISNINIIISFKLELYLKR